MLWTAVDVRHGSHGFVLYVGFKNKKSVSMAAIILSWPLYEYEEDQNCDEVKEYKHGCFQIAHLYIWLVTRVWMFDLIVMFVYKVLHSDLEITEVNIFSQWWSTLVCWSEWSDSDEMRLRDGMRGRMAACVFVCFCLCAAWVDEKPAIVWCALPAFYYEVLIVINEGGRGD